MKKTKEIEIKSERRKFRVHLMMTEREIEKINTDDQMLRERYGITRHDVFRRFLNQGMSDGRILLLMGFVPKKKKK